MAFGVLIKRSEHNWQYHFNIVANEIAEVLIVPKIQCAFSNLQSTISKPASARAQDAYLEMRTRDRLR